MSFLPQLKKKISDFISEEDGSIDKSNLVKLGVATISLLSLQIKMVSAESSSEGSGEGSGGSEGCGCAGDNCGGDGGSSGCDCGGCYQTVTTSSTSLGYSSQSDIIGTHRIITEIKPI